MQKASKNFTQLGRRGISRCSIGSSLGRLLGGTSASKHFLMVVL